MSSRSLSEHELLQSQKLVADLLTGFKQRQLKPRQILKYARLLKRVLNLMSQGKKTQARAILNKIELS